MLIKTEFRKHLRLFLTIYSIEMILDLLTIFHVIAPIRSSEDACYVFIQMLSWIAIIIYIVFDYISYFIFGNDKQYHMFPIEEYKKLTLKGIVYYIYMILLFFLQLTRYLIIMKNQYYMPAINYSVLSFIGKSISIVTFISLLLSILCLVKNIPNKLLACIMAVFIFTIITYLEFIILYKLYASSGSVNWLIGISQEAFPEMNQYINIIPVKFISFMNSSMTKNEILNIYASLLNLCLGLINGVIFVFLIKHVKYNYI